MSQPSGGSALGLLLLTFSLLGCDQSFDPFQSTDLNLSINGYLDATADTQWIRVTPIRHTIFTGQESPGASVTIERVGSGKKVTLTEAVFPHRSVFVENAPDQLAFAYWTNERVTPKSSYQVIITPPGGPASTKTVVIPDDYPVVVRNTGSSVFVRVSVDRLALVRIRCGTRGHELDVPFTVPASENGVFQVAVTRFLTTFPENYVCPAKDTEIFVVVTAEAWPNDPAQSSSSLLKLDNPSGITNAVGFLGGVVTKKFPWGTCSWAVPPVSQPPCDLTYSAESVHLKGRVVDTACGSTVVLSQASLQLTEILPDPNQRARVWTAESDSLGYGIGLLEEGRYVARASSILWDPPNVSPSSPNARRIYGTLEDTLTFVPGQQATLDFALPRLLPCPPRVL